MSAKKDEECRSFCRGLLLRLNVMRQKGMYCDAALLLDGGCLTAHRVILAATSSYFNKAFEGSRDSASIDLSWVPISCMSDILQFVYTGQVNFYKESVSDLKKLADFFGVKELSAQCNAFINDMVTPVHAFRHHSSSGSNASMESDAITVDMKPLPCLLLTVSPEQEDGHKMSGEAKGREEELCSPKAECLTDISASYTTDDVSGTAEDDSLGDERHWSDTSGAGDTAQLPALNVVNFCSPGRCPVEPGAPGTGRSPWYSVPETVGSDDPSGNTAYDVTVNDAKAYDVTAYDAKAYDVTSNDATSNDVTSNDAKAYSVTSNDATSNDATSSDVGSQKATDTSGPPKGKRRYKCKLCPKTFSQRCYLPIHMRKHTAERPYKCHVCAATFARASTLDVHVLIHTGERPFVCSVCSKTFRQRSNLAEHSKTHTGEKAFSCDDCSAAFARKADLTTHQRTHTGEKPYRCPQCPAAFTRRNALASHAATHTGLRPFACDVCGVTFAVLEYLKAHQRTRHHAGPFPCRTCGQRLDSYYALRRHVHAHNKGAHRTFVCEVCSRAFSRGQTLAAHKRTHTGEKPHSCGVCHAAFSQIGNLNAHVRRVHDKLRPFHCDKCEVTFALKDDLTNHMRTHTGDRPFVCGICSKTFAWRGALRKHVKSHSGDKPYRCEVCVARFTSKSYLTIHMRSHTGEAPYRCGLCPAAFTRKDALTRHGKSHVSLPETAT